MPALRSEWLMAGANLDPKFGGISAVLGPLCSSASATGSCGFSLAAFGSGESVPGGIPASFPFQNYPLSNSAWWRGGQTWQALTRQIAAVQGVHIHGVWQKHCAFTSHLSRRARKPYIVSAHGMLDSWALQHRGLKKAIYSFLIEKHNLRHAACLHALTLAEADDCRRFAGQRPIAIVPNGVSIPGGDSELFFEHFPELRGRKLVLFLGRLHSKKGLDLLCRAWPQVAALFPDAHLVIAGPDYEQTLARTEGLVSSLGIAHRVTFTGMLTGPLKWAALAASQLFVLPSYSEGFSVAVLEAMGMGLPVIVTEQCHIPEVLPSRCGWMIQPNVPELEGALLEALSMAPLDRIQMGNNGKHLVESRFSWPVVGAKMAALYSWVLGGPRPPSLEVV